MQVHPADSGAGAEGEPDPIGWSLHGQPSPELTGQPSPLGAPGEWEHMSAPGLGPTSLPAEPRPWPLPRPSLQKYDYDSSSVRKRFFREALLQITIPFLLKKLAPTCKSVSPRSP